MGGEHARKQLKFFINASLSSLAEQRLNMELAAMVERAGHEVYLPQRELPIGGRASASDILVANSAAVLSCDVVLVVLDKPGLGVAFEVGLAYAARKRMVLFRSDLQDYLGKVLEGLWETHDGRLKASTIDGLSLVLSTIHG